MLKIRWIIRCISHLHISNAILVALIIIFYISVTDNGSLVLLIGRKIWTVPPQTPGLEVKITEHQIHYESCK